MSHDTTLVSAVIPTFNHAAFLPAAIESALDQDYVNLEIIVVDDGSTDETRAIVARYGDGVRYIWQENAGLSAARNTAIRAARGSHVALLDADDVWLPAFLSTVMDRWQSDPALGAVYTGFYTIDQEGQRLPQVSTSTVPAEDLYDRLLDGEFFVPSAVVTRRDCFDRVGLFDEGLRGSEDWDMWLRVARDFPMAGIPIPLVNYRVHGNNMSGQPDFMLRYQLMVVEKHFGQGDGPPERWPRARQRAYAAVCRFAVHSYYLSGDAETSRRYLGLALEANPDLCASVDMFYELGCADQPLGQRSIRAKVNIEKNADFMMSSLDEIFSRPDLSARLRPQGRTARGRALLAAGLLAYGNERLALARVYMARALANDPRLWTHRSPLTTIAKTLLGRRILQAARRRRGRDAHLEQPG